MTVVYLQTSVSSVHVGRTGHTHTRAGDDLNVAPFGVDCDACEADLVREGAVYDRELVPLTDRQQREKERVEREGNLAVKQVADALAETVAGALVGRTGDGAARPARRARAAAGE